MGRVGPAPPQEGVGRPGLDGIVEVQRPGVPGGEVLARADGGGGGEEVVPGGADEGVPSGEVPVEEELVGMGGVGAGPGVRRDHVQQVGVAGSVGEPPVEEEEAAVEGVFERRGVGRVVGGQGLEGAGVAASAVEGDVVGAAQQGARGVEQGVEGRTDEDVAVVEEHLAVAAQAEGFEGVEVFEPAGEGRMGVAQAGEPAPERGGHRLEAHEGRDGPEGVAGGLRERVVDDDEVAVEARVVFEEGGEEDEGAGEEGLGGDGGEAQPGGGRGRHGSAGRVRRAGGAGGMVSPGPPRAGSPGMADAPAVGPMEPAAGMVLPGTGALEGRIGRQDGL